MTTNKEISESLVDQQQALRIKTAYTLAIRLQAESKESQTNTTLKSRFRTIS